MFVALMLQHYQARFSGRKLNKRGIVEGDDEIDENLVDRFLSATSFLPSIVGTLDKEVALKLYGLYKQSNEGPPDPANRPSWYESAARYKFDAWCKVAAMSRSDAMEMYCAILNDLNCGWDPKKKSSGGGWNIRPSTMGTIEPEMFDDFVQMDPVRMETAIERKWFEAMRNDDVDEMRRLFEIDPEILEAKDQHLAMTALARAIDLGCERVAIFLINMGADVNVKDISEQTPLHFAAQCHRRNLAELLIAAGADRSARDTDGNTPAQCCDDEEFSKFLSF